MQICLCYIWKFSSAKLKDIIGCHSIGGLFFRTSDHDRCIDILHACRRLRKNALGETEKWLDWYLSSMLVNREVHDKILQKKKFRLLFLHILTGSICIRSVFESSLLLFEIIIPSFIRTSSSKRSVWLVGCHSESPCIQASVVVCYSSMYHRKGYIFCCLVSQFCFSVINCSTLVVRERAFSCLSAFVG